MYFSKNISRTLSTLDPHIACVSETGRLHFLAHDVKSILTTLYLNSPGENPKIFFMGGSYSGEIHLNGDKLFLIGQGKLTYNNGCELDGVWELNKFMKGTGKLHYTDCLSYCGGLKGNEKTIVKQGTGTFTFSGLNKLKGTITGGWSDDHLIAVNQYSLCYDGQEVTACDINNENLVFMTASQEIKVTFLDIGFNILFNQVYIKQK